MQCAVKTQEALTIRRSLADLLHLPTDVPDIHRIQVVGLPIVDVGGHRRIVHHVRVG